MEGTACEGAIGVCVIVANDVTAIILAVLLSRLNNTCHSQGFRLKARFGVFETETEETYATSVRTCLSAGSRLPTIHCDFNFSRLRSFHNHTLACRPRPTWPTQSNHTRTHTTADPRNASHRSPVVCLPQRPPARHAAPDPRPLRRIARARSSRRCRIFFSGRRSKLSSRQRHHHHLDGLGSVACAQRLVDIYVGAVCWWKCAGYGCGT